MAFHCRATKRIEYYSYRLRAKTYIVVYGRWYLGWSRLRPLLTVAHFRITPTIGNRWFMFTVCMTSANVCLVCSDDSLGYEFPFTLKVVKANGIHCGICPWTKFCKGCPLPPTPDPLPYGSETDLPCIEGVLNYCIAVDWEPTALHLRYQTSLEKVNLVSFIVVRFGVNAELYITIRYLTKIPV